MRSAIWEISLERSPGPTEYAPTNGEEEFQAVSQDAAGHILVAGSAATEEAGISAVMLARLDGSTGDLEWTTVVVPLAPQQPLPWVAAAGNGDAVLASLAVNDQFQIILDTWRIRGADGSLVWGPQSLGRTLQSSPFFPSPPFAALIASNGRVFEAQRIDDGFSIISNVFELDGATGDPACLALIAPLPIQGGTLRDIAGGADGSMAVVGDDARGAAVTYKYSREDGALLWGPSVLDFASAFQAQIDAAGNIVLLVGGSAACASSVRGRRRGDDVAPGAHRRERQSAEARPRSGR